MVFPPIKTSSKRALINKGLINENRRVKKLKASIIIKVKTCFTTNLVKKYLKLSFIIELIKIYYN